MTCVVGFVDAEGVHLGGDSIAIARYDMQTRAMPKVFKLDGPAGPMLVGVAGSLRLRDVLQYRFVAPVPEPEQSTHEYMATAFTDALAQLLQVHALLHAENEIREMTHSNLLVAYRGQLFEIDQDFQIGVHTQPFAAIGVGAAIALGAMFASDGQPAKKRIRTALKASEAFCAGVRGPFKVLSLLHARPVESAPSTGETPDVNQ